MLALILWLMNAGSGAELRVSLNNIQEAKGSVYVAVYASETDFLSSEKMTDRKIIPVSKSGTLDVAFVNLPTGAYAISCFHDINGNGKLDTNLFGVPTEPYGFSNNARPQFRAPFWGEAKFDLKKSGESQAIWLQ